jgi:hypothetical protein
MTAQAETDNRVREPGQASMALGAIVVAVLFALSLAFWAGGPFVFKGLLHDLAPLAERSR